MYKIALLVMRNNFDLVQMNIYHIHNKLIWNKNQLKNKEQFNNKIKFSLSVYSPYY